MKDIETNIQLDQILSISDKDLAEYSMLDINKYIVVHNMDLYNNPNLIAKQSLNFFVEEKKRCVSDIKSLLNVQNKLPKLKKRISKSCKYLANINSEKYKKEIIEKLKLLNITISNIIASQNLIDQALIHKVKIAQKLDIIISVYNFENKEGKPINQNYCDNCSYSWGSRYSDCCNHFECKLLNFIIKHGKISFLISFAVILALFLVGFMS